MGENTTENLNTAIMKIMADVKYIKKTMRNQSQNFMFAGAEQVINKVRAAALKHGVRISVSYCDAQELEPGETSKGSKVYRVGVKADVTLHYGSEKETNTFYGDGADSGDKALPKAKTMCLKQALRQIFLIETGEHDADAESPMAEDKAEVRLKNLPDDIKEAFKWLKNQPQYKDTHSATFRSGVIAVMDANNDDAEGIRAYLRDKGWRGNVLASDMATQRMP